MDLPGGLKFSILSLQKVGKGGETGLWRGWDEMSSAVKGPLISAFYIKRCTW